MKAPAEDPGEGYPYTTTFTLWAAVIMLAAASVYAATALDKPAGDPAHGQTVYQVCMGCHSLDEDDVGPRHRGVVGRTAGSVPGYAYSPALRNSHIVWDRDSLDRSADQPAGAHAGRQDVLRDAQPAGPGRCHRLPGRTALAGSRCYSPRRWRRQRRRPRHAPGIVIARDFMFAPLNVAISDFTFRFDKPGTYHYACSIHPRMVGTITVR